jgi:D-xylose transport system substrate-binding protein
MRKHQWLLVLVAVTGLVLAACGGGGGGGGGGGTKQLIVGISWNNYAQPRWAKADGPAIRKAVTDAGGKVIETNANDSSEQQLTDIDNLIAQKAQVLIVLAKDTKAILPAVSKAKQQGIPVIGYDRLIEDTSALYLSFNNQLVGTIMAQQITKVVPSGNYAIVKGHSADPNADFLRSGMTPVLNQNPGVKVVCEDYNDNWDTSNARKMMDACLAAHNNKIDAVISENDSMATGVVAALSAVGLAGKVPVTGQDGDTPALNRVALGTQLVSVWKDAFALGETAGYAAVQLAQGKALKDLKAPSDLKDHVRPDSLSTAQFKTPGGNNVWSIILKPSPITKDNLNIVVDLGWETKAAVCANVPPGKVNACG